MALTGVHVVCSKIAHSGRWQPESLRGDAIALPAAIVWSQTLATPGATALAPPPETIADGLCLFEVCASSDVWVACGPNPDATQKPRKFIPACEPRQFIPTAGDKLARAAA